LIFIKCGPHLIWSGERPGYSIQVHCIRLNVVVLLILVFDLVLWTWDIPMQMSTTLTLHYPSIFSSSLDWQWWVASGGAERVWGHTLQRPHDENSDDVATTIRQLPLPTVSQ